MLSQEEFRVLAYLTQQVCGTAATIARACMPGASAEWFERILSNLDWLGYISIFHGPDGKPIVVQVTSTGLSAASQAAVS